MGKLWRKWRKQQMYARTFTVGRGIRGALLQFNKRFMDYRFCSEVGENKGHPAWLLFKRSAKEHLNLLKTGPPQAVSDHFSVLSCDLQLRTQMFCWQTVSQTHRAITGGNGCKQPPLACLLIIVTCLISTCP